MTTCGRRTLKASRGCRVRDPAFNEYLDQPLEAGIKMLKLSDVFSQASLRK
jgi:hypothetical protein